jgi:hypothetical protein
LNEILFLVGPKPFQVFTSNGYHFQKSVEYLTGILCARSAIHHPMLIGAITDLALSAMTAPGPFTGNAAIAGYSRGRNIRRIVLGAPARRDFIQGSLVFGLSCQVSLTFGAI